jgi:predicted enzyme related to lactoylglutathione lyase
MGAPVTWFEINSRNSTTLREFYAKLFGWSTQQVVDEPPYALVETSDGGIGGGIAEAQGPTR